MPVLFVNGISNKMVPMLPGYTEALINTVACSVKELKLEQSDISCFFPKDLMTQGLGNEIIIFVKGLFVKPRELLR